MEDELADRKQFALTSGIDSQIRDALVATLQQRSALWAFSKTLKEHGLARKWHLYRLQAVTTRIRKWCESTQVEWHQDWIRSGSEPRGDLRRSLSPSAAFTRGEGQLIDQFLGSLESGDLKRIYVPLDIVLKLLGR
jgi:hypothetical protein